MQKEVYVIVEYDTMDGSYRTYAYKGLFFTDRNEARKVLNNIPFNYDYDIETLTLYNPEE